MNKIRVGGLIEESFTNAFVDIKVEEIEQQVVPEPGSVLALLGVGALGATSLRKKKEDK